MATPEENKVAVLDLFETLIAGDFETARSTYFSPDCRFWKNGDMPLSGWIDMERFFRQARFVTPDGPMTMRFGRLIAEGNLVVAEADSDCRLQSGYTYQNTYVFLLTFRDGRVTEFVEHTDSLHEFRTIDIPEVRGEPHDRESPLSSITRTIVGNLDDR